MGLGIEAFSKPTRSKSAETQTSISHPLVSTHEHTEKDVIVLVEPCSISGSDLPEDTNFGAIPVFERKFLVKVRICCKAIDVNVFCAAKTAHQSCRDY